MSEVAFAQSEAHTTTRRVSAAKLYEAALAARTRRHLDQPLYYGGKWWAKRLAVVTRWVIQQALGDDARGVILDPFAGSGTTLGEALRLGHRAIGVEISPFAAILVRETFSSRHPRLGKRYEAIAEQALREVEPLYGGAEGASGYFWVHERACSECGADSFLLNRSVLVQHAYPRRKPAGWVLCPYSRDVFPVKDVTASTARCPCGESISLEPHVGLFRCTACKAVLSGRGMRGEEAAHAPSPVLVAVERRDDGARTYRQPTPADLALARAADGIDAPFSAAPIERGRSTRQLLDWGYSDWAELFHPRQRVLAAAITRRVARTRDPNLRTQLALAFSPLLEYHCRLTSFKGLGTGSIRQAFGRPVLHPVSISFEMNPLFGYSGQLKPSGDVRSWYARRTERSAEAFAQLRQERGSGISLGTGAEVVVGKADLAVQCADSSELSLPEASVDAVVTDPPYFNRVHYDDLAGGLNAWLDWCGTSAVQNGRGIQSDNRADFAERAYLAFRPATKALKPSGQLVFTFHHQELDAWVALAEAMTPLPVTGRSLLLVPSEMPNALIKQRAQKPISCDVVLSLTKEARRLTLKNGVHRASTLAVRALADCPSVTAGDFKSAAYGAGLIVGLRSAAAPADWAVFLTEVQKRVEASLKQAGAHVVG